MTCFWDGIISSLSIDDLNILELIGPTPIQLAKQLQYKNIETKSILWNNTKLTTNQLAENSIHIQDYLSQSVHNGYLCSICDPFLCLLCELLKTNIKHTYLGNTMYYEYPSSTKTLCFCSNRGHFWKL